MTSVPSSNIITVMLANYLTNNDPDKWLDMMNEKSKELSMTNTKWFNASGAAAVAFKGYYSCTRGVMITIRAIKRLRVIWSS